MNQAKIGSFLKELRKEKNLTQEQLAEEFNVASRTVSRWENGNNMPDLSILVELADFYDVDIRELIDGERKSENMTEEMKDTLVKVADYSETEKENIIKKLYGSIIGAALIFLALWIIPIVIDVGPAESTLLRYSQLRGCIFCVVVIGLLISGMGVIRIMQVMGRMNKERVRKLRNVLLPISVVVFVLAVLAIFGLLTTMFHWNVSETGTLSEYSKSNIISTYNRDLDSNLSIFPDENIVTNENSNYIARISTGIFDTDSVIILESEFSSEQFDSEKERLENLQMTIRSGGEEYTNKVCYDSDSYNYPAYITIDGFADTYEYALIDDTNRRIIYVYLAYPEIETFEWKDYLKIDLSSYNNGDNTSMYSMYNHSFDDGKNFVEYDD